MSYEQADSEFSSSWKNFLVNNQAKQNKNKYWDYNKTL